MALVADRLALGAMGVSLPPYFSVRASVKDCTRLTTRSSRVFHWLHLKNVVQGPASLFSIGKSPFEISVVTKGVVSLDVADLNFQYAPPSPSLRHRKSLRSRRSMSNSSYARTLDLARYNFFLAIFGPTMVGPDLHTSIGPEQSQLPLGATQYLFIKEIGILKPYEIEIKLVSWDEKWVRFLFAVIWFHSEAARGYRFTTLPNSRRKGKEEVHHELSTPSPCQSHVSSCSDLASPFLRLASFLYPESDHERTGSGRRRCEGIRRAGTG